MLIWTVMITYQLHEFKLVPWVTHNSRTPYWWTKSWMSIIPSLARAVTMARLSRMIISISQMFDNQWMWTWWGTSFYNIWRLICQLLRLRPSSYACCMLDAVYGCSAQTGRENIVMVEEIRTNENAWSSHQISAPEINEKNFLLESGSLKTLWYVTDGTLFLELTQTWLHLRTIQDWPLLLPIFSQCVIHT